LSCIHSNEFQGEFSIMTNMLVCRHSYCKCLRLMLIDNLSSIILMHLCYFQNRRVDIVYTQLHLGQLKLTEKLSELKHSVNYHQNKVVTSSIFNNKWNPRSYSDIRHRKMYRCTGCAKRASFRISHRLSGPCALTVCTVLQCTL
jgi:hypothetical protein